MTRDGIGIVGATGRLGSAIGQVCAARGVPLLAAASTSGWTVGTRAPAVLIDASRPAALTSTIAFCRRHSSALLYCVSDPGPEDLLRLRELSTEVPVGLIANLSPLQWIQTRAVELSGHLAHALELDAEITVVDRHTAAKVDAPSATARLLSEALEKRAEVISERFGVRVCDHRVLFASGGETYEITHSVRDLAVAAAAAVRLGEQLARAGAGWYTTDALYSRITALYEGD
ncbi:dihydrodipicolinate reductase C-terminal domain-containing protein [Nocardia sp. NPDC058058]|uniref:dihydrodipicolinate reductase C-terminal domain-containing protein n=1 Tax=Nocardia sp. NPDC058058 TaxID=3346317 RepID=UPI0036D9014C